VGVVPGPMDILQIPRGLQPQGAYLILIAYISNISLPLARIKKMARHDQQSTRKSRSPFEILRFIAWLLLLLVSISTPAVKSLYFFSLGSTEPGSISIRDTNYTTTGVVHFGAYGYCIPFIMDGGASLHCSNGVLGHTFDAAVQDALGVSGIEDVYAASSSKAMVLNPLSCAFAFLSMLNNENSIFVPLFTTAAFLFDVISVTAMRSQVSRITGGAVDISFGPCTWLTLSAFIFIWIFYIIYAVYSAAVLFSSVKLLQKELLKDTESKDNEDNKADIELV